ncbi:MAG: plasmid replication, integration and excision activator [Acidimicrobiales bacterium]
MALQGAIPVEFGEVFPQGCFAVGEVEPVRDFERSTKDSFVQAVDKVSGLLWWSIDVVDGDPAARDKMVRVKLAAAVKPTPPAQVDGVPFRPVELDGLAVTPYVVTTASGRGRLAYSFRAKGLRAPGPRAVKAAAS